MGILTGRRGLAPAVLILLIVFALSAVVMLTGTLVAARRINDDVKTIRPEVSEIKGDTKAIALAKRTNSIAIQIRRAAVPLTGKLTDTLSAAKDIDKVAKSILGKVGAINQTAGAINGNVTLINTTVGLIDANASSINASVRAINNNARSISASVNGINSSANGINSSVRSIQGRGSTILATTRLIDPAVADINRHAVIIQGVATGIAGDLSSVFGIVGDTSNGDGRTIHGHANSIDCSTLLNLLGRTMYCNR